MRTGGAGNRGVTDPNAVGFCAARSITPRPAGCRIGVSSPHRRRAGIAARDDPGVACVFDGMNNAGVMLSQLFCTFSARVAIMPTT
jgi:hypothetical protein